MNADAFFAGLRDFYATWRYNKAGTDDFRVAMERVWEQLEACGPRATHDAHFACALAIAWPNDGQNDTFEGRVDGTLVWPPRGKNGFGYDAMFVANGDTQTFGEIDDPMLAADVALFDRGAQPSARPGGAAARAPVAAEHAVA